MNNRGLYRSTKSENLTGGFAYVLSGFPLPINSFRLATLSSPADFLSL